MKVIVFGATGMVGQGVLREALLAADVEQVLAVGRSATGVHHPKLREARVADAGALGGIRAELAGYDACFYCLGVTSVGTDEGEYQRISSDYPLAAAKILKDLNPQLTFVYVSGAGTNPTGRQRWQRVKGRTENEIIKMFPNGYAFRPAMIQPTRGVRSKTRLYQAIYTATGPLLPTLVKIAPKYVTTTDRVGRAMLRAARTGFPDHVVENAEMR